MYDVVPSCSSVVVVTLTGSVGVIATWRCNCLGEEPMSCRCEAVCVLLCGERRFESEMTNICLFIWLRCEVSWDSINESHVGWSSGGYEDILHIE